MISKNFSIFANEIAAPANRTKNWAKNPANSKGGWCQFNAVTLCTVYV